MIECKRSNGCNIISLEVPGRIEFRDIVLRAVSAAHKLVMPDTRMRGSRHSELTEHMASAVGEAYNNIVLHGYAGREPDSIRLEIETCPEWMRIMIKDTGISFDPALATSPDPYALPNSGVGTLIKRWIVDETTYFAGHPNILTLLKRFDEGGTVSSMTPVLRQAVMRAEEGREILAEREVGTCPEDRSQRAVSRTGRA